MYQRSALNGIANRNGQQRIANTQEDNRYLLNVWQRKEKGNVKTKFGQHVIFPVQIDGNNMVKFDSCFLVAACGGYGLLMLVNVHYDCLFFVEVFIKFIYSIL